MDEEPIIQVPGIVPFRWTARGFMDAINAGLMKHPRGTEMIGGIAIIDVWAPHGVVPEGPGVDPYRWDADEFLAIIDAGLIDEPHRVELLNGIMAWKAVPDDESKAIHGVLMRALEAANASRLIESPRVTLGSHSVCEPAFAILRPESTASGGPLRERDLLWASEVATAFDRDLSPRKDAYARAGVPDYWVLDAGRRGVWSFSRPEGGVYREERFAPGGKPIGVPSLADALDPESFFPTL